MRVVSMGNLAVDYYYKNDKLLEIIEVNNENKN